MQMKCMTFQAADKSQERQWSANARQRSANPLRIAAAMPGVACMP
jgi:hypothetical protein